MVNVSIPNKIGKMNQVHHKIRGSYPGYIGIEMPDNYSVLLLDEENFNAYRKHLNYNGLYLKVQDHYCHFEKPIEGSWHIVIEGTTCNFSPSSINIIYRAA